MKDYIFSLFLLIKINKILDKTYVKYELNVFGIYIKESVQIPKTKWSRNPWK